jgi:protein-disulfide isomerase
MSRLVVPVTDRDHMRGTPEAPAVLVEYGDYECPHCAAAQPIVDSICTMLNKNVCYVFRHFPLNAVHPHAQHAAEAAEAAAAQQMFWPMHELLFEQQEALDDASLLAYAAELGLDVERFGTELASGVYGQRVREDFLGGVRSGVNGTPSFFINGLRYDGSYHLESLFAAVRQAAMVNTPLGGARRAKTHP